MATVKDFYDNYTSRYEAFEGEALKNKKDFPLLYDIRNKEWELLKNVKDEKVFYFATGSGRDITKLAKSGAKLVTLDFSEEMISKAQDRLKSEGTNSILVKEITNPTKDYLDRFFVNNPKSVFILVADINEVSLPDDYFDYTFSYCTIPLLGNTSLDILEKMLKASKKGAVSVYDKDKLPDLNKYYTNYGFESKIHDDTITISGGFEYRTISTSDMEETIKKYRNMEIIQIGLGKIYLWY